MALVEDFPFYELPFTFDVAELRHELQAADEQWASHFLKAKHGGGWQGMALRSPDGAITNLSPGASYMDTPLLEQSPYFRDLLSSFECPLMRVRILRLSAGAVIDEHLDPPGGLLGSEVRIHVPIITNPDVEFIVNHQRVVMLPGTTWYIDHSYPHQVANHGTEDRIHLVIDCVPDPWLYRLFPEEVRRRKTAAVAARKYRLVSSQVVDVTRAVRSGDRDETRRVGMLLLSELGLRDFALSAAHAARRVKGAVPSGRG